MKDRRWWSWSEADAEQEEAEILNSGIPITLSMKENGYGNPAAASGLPRGSAVVLRTSEPAMPKAPVFAALARAQAP